MLDKLEDHIAKVGMDRQYMVESCEFYKEYICGETFTCTNLIYSTPLQTIKLNGTCQL